VIAFVLGLFLTIGGYILQRDKYWRRIWEGLGKLEVENVKELKALEAVAISLSVVGIVSKESLSP